MADPIRPSFRDIITIRLRDFSSDTGNEGGEKGIDVEVHRKHSFDEESSMTFPVTDVTSREDAIENALDYAIKLLKEVKKKC